MPAVLMFTKTIFWTKGSLKRPTTQYPASQTLRVTSISSRTLGLIHSLENPNPFDLRTATSNDERRTNAKKNINNNSNR